MDPPNIGKELDKCLDRQILVWNHYTTDVVP